jgi:rfaE bifunctional protein nucleotidyltransferase chain/domain
VLNSRGKILALDALTQWRRRLRESGRRLVATNGCFDLLHAGHVTYLEAARNLGDALLVGLNSDVSVRALKGPGRPVNSEQDRALVLAALESVDGVVIFYDVRAKGFLTVCEPDIYVKGGDYTLETLDPQERVAVERAGGRIVLIPMVAGKSTTGLLTKLKAASA